MKNISIGCFKKYTKKPNAIYKGTLYTTTLTFENNNKIINKTIRVYLPSNYNFNDEQKYPVLYMFDGQNIVDEYTTKFGEWNLDEEIEKLIKSKAHKGIIIVGIDSPFDDQERMNELCPKSNILTKKNNDYINNPYLEIFSSFIVNKVKPLIDETFKTLNDKENTGIGGSSMGGLASFYMGVKYKSIFGFTLSFSPAFLLFNLNKLKTEIKKIDFTSIGKIYFYLGGVDFEKSFIPGMNIVYNYLSSKINDKIIYKFDKEGKHNEESWQKQFSSALTFLRP